MPVTKRVTVCGLVKKKKKRANKLLEQLTPWNMVLLEKLTVTQLVKKFPTSLSYSQEPVTGPYPEPDEFIPHLPTHFPKIYRKVFPSTPRSS